MFNPETFLDQQILEANSSKPTPVPEGEYFATIESCAPRSWVSSKDPTKSGVSLDIVWVIDDENVKIELGRAKVTCKQNIMLDLTDSGAIATGKGQNVGLGRLREAVNLNQPGRPFSFSMLPGSSAKVSVKHRISEADSDTIYAEVRAVARLA